MSKMLFVANYEVEKGRLCRVTSQKLTLFKKKKKKTLTKMAKCIMKD